MIFLSVLTWILTGLLAAMMLMAGGVKLAKPHGEPPMATLRDYSETGVRLIGLAEIAGALGIVLPVLTGIATFLTPLAAIGLALIHFLAIFTHIKHDEPYSKNIVLMLVALAIATLRVAGV